MRDIDSELTVDFSISKLYVYRDSDKIFDRILFEHLTGYFNLNFFLLFFRYLRRKLKLSKSIVKGLLKRSLFDRAE
jgi:hypothetical protein